MVIRNHRGDFLDAFKEGIEKISNPEMVEMIAFMQVILLAMQQLYKTDSNNALHFGEAKWSLPSLNSICFTCIKSPSPTTTYIPTATPKTENLWKRH
jgi:hypothetical protein